MTDAWLSLFSSFFEFLLRTAVALVNLEMAESGNTLARVHLYPQ